MPTIVTVLRSGGIYTPDHVRWFDSMLPDVRHVCISDVEIDGIETIKTPNRWPKWWAKLNLFNPDILSGETIHYFDIDQAIVGPIDDILALDTPMMLRDWYWPNEVNSSIMVIPPDCKCAVWHEWIKSPRAHMQRHRRKGDQEFIGRHFDHGILQDVLPGQCVSWKVHVAPKSYSHRSEGDGTVPASARVICGHGKPRVWALDIEGVPSLKRRAVA